MQQTEFTDQYGRLVIRRAWCTTEIQLHRTTGSAVEEWTGLPCGAHVLSYQSWYQNGKQHREGRPARRQWHVADDGARVLLLEEWGRHGRGYRAGGPSYRTWTVTPDGTRILHCVWWFVNGRLHRVDGPAEDGRRFWWQDKLVQREDLPWLRRGRSSLVALAGVTGATPTLCSDGDGGAGGRGVSPAWSRDARVVVSAGDAVVPVYRSAVGGSVLLCV